MPRKSMIGAVVGDVVGSRFEWHNCYSKEFDLFGLKCALTDDSVLTLAIGEALRTWREAGGDLAARAVKALREWALAYPDAGYGGSFADWVVNENPQPYNSWGNGAAMRVSPCGWAATSLNEAHSLSDAVTGVTHNHPEGLSGARVTAGCVYLARTGAPKETIREYIESTYRRLDFTVDGIRPTYAPPGTFHVSCQNSVPQALECFLESTSFEDAIRTAISLGGDSDTIGAITGSIAGAFYGVPEDVYDEALAYCDDRQRTALLACDSLWAVK